MHVQLDTVASPDNPKALAALLRARTIAGRIRAMDEGAVVRVRPIGERSVDLFFSTPLRVLISQRIPGRLPAGDTAPEVAHLSAVLQALDDVAERKVTPPQGLDFGPECPLMWRGSLPPEAGFALVDRVPGASVRELYAAMAAENDRHGGPLGIARSLLEQGVLAVASEGEGGERGEEVTLEGRVIAALGALGLVQEPWDERMREFDFVRVAVTGSWIRVDGLFGTLYTPRPGGLARVP